MPNLGAKPSEWEGLIASDRSCLDSPASAKIVAKILATAGSRAPQKQLHTAVANHIPHMTGNESGCSILTSLIRYGTKQTVGVVVATAAKSIDVRELTLGKANLIAAACRRPECSSEADAALGKLVKALLANPALPFALTALSSTLGLDAKLLAQPKVIAAMNGIKGHELLGFVGAVIDSASNKSEAGAQLWGVLSNNNPSAEIVSAIAGTGADQATMVGKYIVQNNLVSSAPFEHVVAGCIKDASDSVAGTLLEVALKSDPQASVIAAIQHRYPEQAFASPKLAAAATQWTRAHQSAFQRTRDTVNARLAQKRNREDDDEF